MKKKKLLLTVFVLLFLFIASLPLLFSTSWGQKALISFISHKIPGKLEVESLSLSWFGGQKAENLHWEDEKISLQSRELLIEAPLWRIISKSLFSKSSIPLVGITHFNDLQIQADSISFQNVNATLNLKRRVAFYCEGKTRQDGQEGQFLIKGDFKPKTPLFNISASVVNLPLTIIDKFMEKEWVVTTLGPTVNLELNARSQIDAFEVDLMASSSLMSAEAHTQSQNGHVFLKSPAKINFILSKEIAELYSLPLKSRARAEISLNRVDLPLSETGVDLSLLSFESFITLVNRELNAELSIGSQKLQDQINFKFSASDHHLEGTIEEPLEKVMHVSIKGDKVVTEFDASLKNSQFVIPKSFVINYLLTPQTLNKFIPDLPLSAPTKVILTLDPLTLPISKCKGKAKIAKLLLKDSQFKDTEGHFEYNPSSNHFFATLVSTAIKEEKPVGYLDADISIDGLLTPEPLSQIHGNIQNLLPSFIDTFLPQKISPLLGNSVTIDFLIKDSPKEETIVLKAESENLVADLHIMRKDHLYELKKPGSVHLKLTPDAFKLLGQKGLELATPTKGLLTLTRLSLPSDGNWSALLCEGNLQIDNFSLRETKTDQVTTLSKLQMSLSKTGKASPLFLTLNANMASGQMKIEGTLQNLFSANQSTRLQGNLQQFPSLFLDFFAKAFAQSNIPFSALFGKTFNATFSSEIENDKGPVSLNLLSSNTRLSIEGDLNQGILSLREPLYMQMTVTKEVSKELLKDINPLSISSIHALNPMILQIEPKGFSLPLFPLDVSQVQMGQVRIELGKMICHNEGALNITLGLLKQLSKEKELTLWFAPIDLQVKNGVVNIERTEILISNTYDIATWGKMDFVRDKVSMTLGLTAPTLKKAFGIKNLPSNYVLQIPMKGSLDKVSINKTKATAKIAALLAWQQKDIAGGITGGAAGAILGELLNNFSILPDKDSKAPAPKRPYPWESEEASNDTAERKTSPIRDDDKPLKQLLKLLK